MTLPKLSTTFFHKVYHRLLLDQCYVCSINGEGTLCYSCKPFLSYNHSHCQQCARPTHTPLVQCGQCQRFPTSFERIIAPLQYQGLCRAMISKAKFEDKPHLLRPLIQILANLLIQNPGSLDCTAWVIVPTSHTSLAKRGYCQTSFIRQQLQTMLAPMLKQPIQKLTLKRSHASSPQHTLGKQERHKLSHKAFHLSGACPKQVILIDDVVTTGSTVEACAKALKLAGAEQVTVWALARTPE